MNDKITQVRAEYEYLCKRLDDHYKNTLSEDVLAALRRLKNAIEALKRGN